MIKETRALGKNGTLELVPSLPGKKLLAVSGSFQLNRKLMDPLKDIKQG